MPRIKSKVIRVKDPDGIWHDLPAVVSEEAMAAAERANQAAQTAQACIAGAEAAAHDAEEAAAQAQEWTPDAVNAWLDAHPEATTTVQDGSISRVKLTEDLKKKTDPSRFLDNLRFGVYSYMYLASDISAPLQGLCTIDGRYIVVCRYGTNSTRVFTVYDSVTETFLASSTLTEEQVGHCNSMEYLNGYIYVCTLTSNKVVRLAYNSSTHTITYDSVVYSGTNSVLSLAISDRLFYILGNGFTVLRTNDFRTFETINEGILGNNTDNATPQGATSDGEYLYFAFSGTEHGTSYDLETERIYCLTRSGELIKSFTYARGSYGEIEDIGILERDGQKYILVSVNADANSYMASVYCSPIYSNHIPVAGLEPTDWEAFNQRYNFNHACLMVYVDGTYSPSVFQRGTSENPFRGFWEVLQFVQHSRRPVRVVVRGGNFGTIYITDIATPTWLDFQGGTVYKMVTNRVGNIVFDRTSGSGTVFQHVQSDASQILVRVGIKINSADGGVGWQIQRSSIVGGAETEIKNCATGFRVDTSQIVLAGSTENVTTFYAKVVSGYCPLLMWNGVLYGASIEG